VPEGCAYLFNANSAYDLIGRLPDGIVARSGSEWTAVPVGFGQPKKPAK